MTISIINTTNNVGRFEDNFANELSAKLQAKTYIFSAHGELLLNLKIDDKCKILIIICHAGPISDGTAMDLGFKGTYEIINTPNFASKIIKNDVAEHVIFYCACEAWSSETLSAYCENPKVKGVIVSDKKVDASWVDAIAAIINEIYTLDLSLDSINNQIQIIISKQQNNFNLDMGYKCSPNFVIDEST